MESAATRSGALADTPQLNKPRIGVVNYLNAYPLWAALENDNRIELVRGVPSFLARELEADRLDAALISSVEYLRHRAQFVCHPDLCIAAKNESYSIRLFAAEASQPFAEHAGILRRIFTDAASRSSVAQLSVILREIGISVPFEEVSDAADRIPRLAAGEALLAIGDTALNHLRYPSYDMQTEYYRLFHRGFVYALWVYVPQKASQLAPVLASAHRAYLENREQYLHRAIERFAFPADFTRHYLTAIIEHELTAERLADLEFFGSKNI